MRRYENRSTIMISNRLLEEWGKLLNDVPHRRDDPRIASCTMPRASRKGSGPEVSHAKGE